jgi:hypothetical protein
MNSSLDWINASASVATVFALLAAIWQIRENRKQSRTNFEDDLDREYREIIRNIPVKAFLGEELENQEYQQALKYLYQYIDLSNQQVFLRQQGRVSKETWIFWRDGIQSNLSRHPFDKAWHEIKEKGQPSFSELIRLDISGFKDDPKDW